MATAPLPQRVNTLEQALIDLAQAQARTEVELREFKDEMRASAERADRRWGELANKMGTLVEDIVFPGIATVFRRIFPDQGEPECALRVTRKHAVDRGRTREFDSLAASDEVFLVVETKSRLSPTDPEDQQRRLAEVRDFFPEAHGRRVYGALASFHVDASPVRAGERLGLLMLGLDSGLLLILNGPDFVPRAF